MKTTNILKSIWHVMVMASIACLVGGHMFIVVTTSSLWNAIAAAIWAWIGFVYVYEYILARRREMCKPTHDSVTFKGMEPKIFEVTVDGVGSVYKGTDQDEASDAYVGYTSDPAYADAHIGLWEDGEMVEERNPYEFDFSDSSDEQE